MFKKIIYLVLLFALLASLAACADNSKTQNSTSPSTAETTPTTDNNLENQPTKEKISSEIAASSVFSEGLAFVSLHGAEDKTYCIDPEGYIVFELDVSVNDFMGEISSHFVNGLALIDGGICDKTGKITYPEDVGATAFCDLALEGNYIIAERITSDYNSSKKELGVMNASFEWIVEPSDELYDATGGISDMPIITNCFYDNGWFYFERTKIYLNLSTGETRDTVNQAFPSKQWIGYQDRFYDYDNNVMLDLSNYETIDLSYTSFVNGKAPVRFINRETGKHYFSLIDEQGRLLFEPVETIQITGFSYDGNNILVINDNQKIIQSYDDQGNFLGEIGLDTISKNKAWGCTVANGTIRLSAGYNFNYTCYYLKPDMSPLF